MIDWGKANREDHFKAAAIADRVLESVPAEKSQVVMDIIACHVSGCPLDLDRLHGAAESDLLHDVCGIARHLDRQTGKLTDCFVPRYAESQHSKGV
jgi:hypothetical protein